MGKTLSFRRLIAYIGLAIMISLQPLAVYADDTVPPVATETVQEPAAPVTEQQTSTAEPITTPVEQTTTPPTTETAPLPAPAEPDRIYSYNRETKKWDSDKWVFNPISGRYEPAPKPVAKASSPLTSAANNAPDTKEGVDKNVDGTSELGVVTSTDIKNMLDSIATSGSAIVSKNTNASNATSGDATATATIINNLNSSISNSDNTKAATFVADVMGDVRGDIMLKPMLLKAMLEAEVEDQISSKLDAQNSTNISNDINLTAASGDASVTKNTKAGDATTGGANTVANVVNIVNSMIAANKSFIGTVNIYGNLEGDILIAPDFIPQLLASNSPLSTSPVTPAKSLVVDSEDTKIIINNVNLNAASGQATVAGNTTAGSATTGSADTNTVIFNMTGHDIIAKNSLLVFVNVLGKWVGVIVDAPTGATSAVIGNGVSKFEQAADLAITAKNDVQLINNLNLNSISGDALVAGNTTAGSARSGNATASANIANISNSQFGLSDWFGILYINVFGSWLGSLGIDTAAGSAVGTESSDPNVNVTNGPLEFIPRGSGAVSASKIIPLAFGTATGVISSGLTEALGNPTEDTWITQYSDVLSTKDSQPVAPKAGLNLDAFNALAATAFIGGLGLVGGSNRRLRDKLRAGRRRGVA